MKSTHVKTKQLNLTPLNVTQGEYGRIAIFASGNGTNAENISRYFQQHDAKVVLIVTDNPRAGVIQRAKELEIECLVVERAAIAQGQKMVRELKQRGISLIALAGFLGQVGSDLIEAYSHRILNIHPALLPKFGGKGMYGDRVHQAVLDAGETQSGITIHLIDEEYDKGTTLCQATCPVDPSRDTVATLAERIHRLEYFYYPIVIEEYIGRLK